MVVRGLGRVSDRRDELRGSGVVGDGVAGVQRLGELAPVVQPRGADLCVVDGVHPATLARGSDSRGRFRPGRLSRPAARPHRLGQLCSRADQRRAVPGESAAGDERGRTRERLGTVVGREHVRLVGQDDQLRDTLDLGDVRTRVALRIGVRVDQAEPLQHVAGEGAPADDHPGVAPHRDRRGDRWQGGWCCPHLPGAG